MSGELSALDATFLELEQADASAHMHIGALLVLDGADAPTPAQVARRVRGRLQRAPRFAQRLSEPTVGGLRRPTWEPATAFDPAAHIRRAALPAPGGERELLDWAGVFFSHRLDRRRPLWEAVIVEGLEDHRWALAIKLHHCLADGVGSLAFAALFEDRPAPTRPQAAPASADGGVPDLLRSGLGALAHPRRTVGQLEALAALIAANEAVAAPASPFNVPMGPARQLAVVRTTLEDIARARRHLRGTVNDVVLTVVASGLRDVLTARGESVGALRAMVPVNVRDGEDLGNRISSRFVALPVDEPDLRRRHQQVVTAGRRIARGRQGKGAATLLELAEHLPPVLHAVFARSAFGTRLFNLTVTNVPGPRRPGRVFGANLTDVIPIVPLAAEHALGVAVISHAGKLTLCVNADPDAVPDLEVMAAGMRGALDELTLAHPDPALAP